ncbi:unnamed protein product [Enterobius vermicularis]|uniref:Oxidoreductase n=1 Tax=Enterobius vermicularis TaxID=51028 RepID=A0A0N4UYQ0_ENTVE|nr:unnamed protein product [Enterobius vermicularis]
MFPSVHTFYGILPQRTGDAYGVDSDYHTKFDEFAAEKG